MKIDLKESMSKPLSPRLQNIRSIYDARAPTYDYEGGPDGFHPRQAADYIKWASPSPGSKILDLACGTGAITIPCACLAGPSGTVIGVDISPASLEIARAKAKKEGLENVKFVEGDVADLVSEWGENEGIREEIFDLIICASAFVLISDQVETVKSWARLLKKDGKLIFDVPTGDSMVRGQALERIARWLGLERFYTREGIDSEEKVRALLTGAGLDDGEYFVSDSYENGEVLSVNGAGDMFDRMVGEKNWFGGWYDELKKPGVIERAKELFCEEMEKLAGGREQVRDWKKFYMAVGKKV